MIILGIDPGIERTGYALIEKHKSDERLLTCGCITTSKDHDLPARLLEIKTDLTSIIKKWKPEVVAVESLFFAANAKTALKVGHARGVVLMVCQELGLDILELTPLQVKIALTGYGRADKKQIEHMVVKVLKLKKTPKPDDAVDACAIAWAGLSRVKMMRLK